jgi:hypothetical protein
VMEPELPELPEFPELPDVAEPDALAVPVLPESALPDEALVALPETEPAEPLVPPVVLPVALELPESPEVDVTVGLEVASPVPPEVALPVAEVPEGGGGSLPLLLSETACGLAVAEPEGPDEFDELFEPLALLVEPVFPEVVCPLVSAPPLVAVDDELEVVLTGPVVPPLPEPPEVAVGLAVASPDVVDPVEPVSPVMMVMTIVQFAV